MKGNDVRNERIKRRSPNLCTNREGRRVKHERQIDCNGSGRSSNGSTGSDKAAEEGSHVNADSVMRERAGGPDC